MPNLKIFVDERRYPDLKTALADGLGPIRAMLCASLDVPVSACQFSVMPVMGMADQPAVNLELQILPRPERTSALLTDLCARLRDRLQVATGMNVAVRLSVLDPATYVALK